MVVYFELVNKHFLCVVIGCSCLVQSIEAENEKGEDYMVNIVTTLISVFERGIHTAFPGISVSVVVTPAAQEKFGDYQCNSAMNIAQVIPAKLFYQRVVEHAV